MSGGQRSSYAETACLDVEDRVRFDEAMVPLYARGGVGDRVLAAAARGHSQRLDPAAAVKRARRAVTERRVTVRPAPDSMAVVPCLLPVAQAIAVHKTLAEHADGLRARGEDTLGRTRDQIMADTVVELITGQSRASAVPIEIQLMMSDATLVGGSPEPGVLVGFGPVPAQIARDLVIDAEAKVALRRVYTSPGSGGLTAMESRSRVFPDGLKAFVALRDVTCRNPWCDAPIRQYDPPTTAPPTPRGRVAPSCAVRKVGSTRTSR